MTIHKLYLIPTMRDPMGEKTALCGSAFETLEDSIESVTCESCISLYKEKEIKKKELASWNESVYPEKGISSGLTKLEYFAGQVMQGLLENQSLIVTFGDGDGDNTKVAKTAIQIAKTLIKELGESKK